MTLFIAYLLSIILAGQAGSKPVQQGDETRRPCLGGDVIALGDTYDSVALQGALRPVAPGEGHTSARGSKRETVYHAASVLPRTVMGAELSQMLEFTFDDRQRLKAAAIVWIYSGEKTPAARDAVFDTVFGELRGCMNLDSGPLTHGLYHHRDDYDTYSEEFTFDARSAEGWSIRYDIRLEP